MSRLLFAAARGARIEWSGPRPQDGNWYAAENVWFATAKTTRRIHPEDAHLAYGPVSTALREMAEDVPDWAQDVSAWATTAIDSALLEDELGCAWAAWREYPLKTRSLFLLILAESLADEGL